jgi:hypothetical protein
LISIRKGIRKTSGLDRSANHDQIAALPLNKITLAAQEVLYPLWVWQINKELAVLIALLSPAASAVRFRGFSPKAVPIEMKFDELGLELHSSGTRLAARLPT